MRRLLVLRYARKKAPRARELRLRAELLLNLDGVELLDEGVNDATLDSRSIDGLVATLRPRLEEKRAAAALWLESARLGQLALNLLVVEDDEAALLRVETPVVHGCELTLAVATRELLRDAEILPESKGAASRATSAPTSEPTSMPASAPARPPEAPKRWVLLRSESKRRPADGLDHALRQALAKIGVKLATTDAPKKNRQSLSQRLRWARAAAGATESLAIGWLTFGEHDVRLNVMSASPARAMLWQLSLSRQPGWEVELAKHARAWTRRLLVNPGRIDLRSRVAKRWVRRRRPAAPRPREPGPQWRASLMGGAQLGLGPSPDESLRGGGRLALGRSLPGGLQARLEVGLHVGPRKNTAAEEISGWGMLFGGALYRGWKLGPVELGPLLGLHASWTKLSIALDGQSPRDFSRWNARVALGAELRWRLSERIALLASASGALTLEEETYRRLSNERSVLKLPRFNVGTMIGLQLLFGR